MAWRIKAKYYEACNCDYGCPCNMNGFPTYGKCEGTLAFQVSEGDKDGVDLSGTKVVGSVMWPGAIHEGNGKLAVFIDGNEQQQQALAAILTRMVRTSMLEELSQDYIRTARAKGLPERTVVYRHALRNAMIPVLTVLGLQFGALLAGAIVTEKIFSWPGIGRLTIDAISSRDYYLVQGCILAIGLTYVAVNFLTDMLYSVANPRIRQ